jgi:hypothetical protein
MNPNVAGALMAGKSPIPEKKEYKCKDCGKIFISIDALAEHEKEHQTTGQSGEMKANPAQTP